MASDPDSLAPPGRGLHAPRRRRIGWVLPTAAVVVLAAAVSSLALRDAALPVQAAFWAACAALVAVLAWIERQHLQASDRRLLQALVERDALIAHLRAHREQLLNLQQQRVQLLAGIAHDMRQPLWALRLYADSLLRQPLDDAQRDLLRQQTSAVDEAQGMLAQFSDLAAIERGVLAVRAEAVDVREVLDAVAAQLLAGRLRGGRLRVYGRGIRLHTDRVHLSRIVQNLAGNAWRHAVALRGEQARVVLGVRPRANGCAIEVLDNGPGIPEDRLARVFEPYVQLHADHGSSGSQGLGLAIVRGLAGVLGMELDVRSAVGRGTRFRVVARTGPQTTSEFFTRI